MAHKVPTYLVLVGCISSAVLQFPVAAARNETKDRGYDAMGVDGAISLPDEDLYRGVVVSPNATGKLPITGFDVSKEYPGAPIDGWTVDVNITADISTANSESSRLSKDGFLTAVSLGIRPPASLLEVSDNGTIELRGDNETLSSWKLCATWMYRLSDSALANSKNDNGSCTSVLGEQCVADLKARFARDFDGDLGPHDVSACPSPSKPPESCSGSMSSSFEAGTTVISLDSNLTAYPMFAYAPRQIHQKGNNSDYDRLGSRAWPIILTWGTTNSTSSTNEAGSNPQVVIACPRPNITLGESKVPGAANMMTATAGWVWATLAVALILGTVC